MKEIIKFMAMVKLEADFMELYGHRPNKEYPSYNKLLKAYIEAEELERS